MRTWGDATRDDDSGKVSYEKITPAILDYSYGQYMKAHRKQADGSLREFDNWQSGFGDTPEANAQVCLESMRRHVLDLSLLLSGVKVSEKGKEINLEEACNSIRFNAQAILYQFIKHTKQVER